VEERPAKRVRLTDDRSENVRGSQEISSALYRSLTSRSAYVPPRTDHPPIQPARSVYEYERLNQIEEGTYGVVFRGRDKSTGDIVALKKLKLDQEKFGFPITALREINALMACRHENVVRIREVVVGDTLTQ
jgi:cell division cycle 2-like protein